MKKLFLFFFIFAVVVVLALVAMNACDRVPTAQAIVYAQSPDGVVRPNLLSYYTYENYTVTTNTTNTQFASNTLDGIYINGTCTFSYPDLSFTGGSTYYLFVVFTAGDYPYYFLSTIFKNDDSSTFSLSGTTYDLTSRTGYNSFSSGSAPVDGTLVNVTNRSSTVNSAYVSGHKYIVRFTANRSSTFRYIKLEGHNTFPTISNYWFTGYPIPDYTYTYVEPSPYTEWDGLVRPNMITDSDLFSYPLYSSTPAVDHQGFWRSDIPTSNFAYSDLSEFGLTFSECLITIPTFSSPREYYTLYYSTDDIPTDNANNVYFDYHFRLAFIPTCNGVVSLLSGGGSESFAFSDSDDEIVYIDLQLPHTKVTTYVTVSIQFENASDPVTWYYSKLEYGTDFFTGYVYEDHPLPRFVAGSLMTNYNFSSVPLSTEADNTWFLSDGSPLIYNAPEGGLTFVSSSWQGFTLTYRIRDIDSIFEGDTLCFTISALSDINIFIQIYSSLEDIHEYYFRASYDYYVYSMYFDYTLDTNINILVSGEGTLSLQYCKLELDGFSGFTGEDYFAYKEGFDAGYSAGFIDGSDGYVNSTFTLSFNNVEAPTWSSFGWFDLGMDSTTLLSSSYSLSSELFESLGYSYFVRGYIFGVDTDNSDAVTIYCSPDPDFVLSNYSSFSSYCILTIFKNRSQLLLNDPSYPSNWNPVSHPYTRVVHLNVQRGMEDLLEKYGDVSFQSGRSEGFADGYSQGLADGKAEGFATAESLLRGSGWLGFFTAFVDVPVKVLMSLLDFDFFGFNLLSIVKIMLLFSLFFMVLRLLTKGQVSK